MHEVSPDGLNGVGLGFAAYLRKALRYNLLNPPLPGRTRHARFRIERNSTQKLREQLRAMSDSELVRFGKALRRLEGQKVSGVPDMIIVSERHGQNGAEDIPRNDAHVTYSTANDNARCRI